MRRIRGPHDRLGFAVVELVVTMTVLALVVGVLADIVIVSRRKPKADPPSQVSPAEAELDIARFLSKDVLTSASATSRKTACGVYQAALVTTAKSTPKAARADQTVAYSIGPNGLTRTTCATGAATASTTTVVSADVTVFSAVCRSPGACGTVHVEAETAGAGNGPGHPFSLDIARKQ